MEKQLIIVIGPGFGLQHAILTAKHFKADCIIMVDPKTMDAKLGFPDIAFPQPMPVRNFKLEPVKEIVMAPAQFTGGFTDKSDYRGRMKHHSRKV